MKTWDVSVALVESRWWWKVQKAVLHKFSYQEIVWIINKKVILAKAHFLLKLNVELRILEFFLVVDEKSGIHFWETWVF